MKTFAVPPGEPLFGSARLANREPLEYYLACQNQFGDYIRFTAFPKPIEYQWYQLTHPAAVEHILQKHQNKYRKPDLFNVPVSLLMGNGLLTSEGETWIRHRRLSQPAFHRQVIQKLVDLMAKHARDFVEAWKPLANGTVIDLHAEMVKLTFKIAGSALFGAEIEEQACQFASALRRADDFLNFKMRNYPYTPPLWISTRRNRAFKEDKNVIDKIVQDIIARRRKTSSDSTDFLQMLMEARDETTGRGMCDDEIRDEVLTLLVAGHDTVAAALTWTWYLLSQYPHIEAQFHDEIDSVLAGGDPSFALLEKLPFTRMVLDESLRLYPPAWGLPRETKEDDEIEGYFIPKQKVVMLSQWVTHRHPAFWDQPECFNPERFLPENSVNRPKFAYFPFGGGSRVCIGQQFALLEGCLLLSSISQSYRFEHVTRSVVPDHTFTLIPKGGLTVTLHKR